MRDADDVRRALRRSVMPLALAGAGVLAACTSTPPPGPALAASSASVEAARAAGAAELASVELTSARTKLERARLLAQNGQNLAAMRLAEQADVDAQLARARAASERSKRAVAEVDASLRTLREELSRSPGMNRPPMQPGQPMQPMQPGQPGQPGQPMAPPSSTLPPSTTPPSSQQHERHHPQTPSTTAPSQQAPAQPTPRSRQTPPLPQ